MKMNSEIRDIVLAGVGGQGILLASAIVARAAMNAGYDVKTNEVHGMAQRGGSVIGQVRYGRKVYSPLVAPGRARVLAAFEKVEALRYADYLASDGLAVVADYEIVPVTVSSGAAKYPSDAVQRLEHVFTKLHLIPVLQIAQELGNAKAANVVLIGALSSGLDLPQDVWGQAVAQSVKPAFKELNLKAFAAGRQAVASVG